MLNHAREAAACLGDRNFNQSKHHIEELDKMIKGGTFIQNASSYDKNYLSKKQTKSLKLS
jgi:hypothetical protein